MKIHELKVVTPNVIKAFERLIPQLSADCNLPTDKDIERHSLFLNATKGFQHWNYK